MADLETAYKALVTVLSQVEQERNDLYQKMDKIKLEYNLKECAICNNLVKVSSDNGNVYHCACETKAVHADCLKKGICPKQTYTWEPELEYHKPLTERLLNYGFFNVEFDMYQFMSTRCNKCQ